jgi:hypothetical protein
MMRRATKKANTRRSTPPEPTVFEQAWFVDMLPSPINGEVRLRMKRPAGWVSVAGARRLMTCSVQTVHNLCEEGALAWRWVGYEGAGGKKLVLVDSIQRYIAKKSK